MGKSTKFNVNKNTEERTYNGVVYDSRIEMLFYIDYILPRIKSGEVIDCNSQVKYELQPSYIYIDENGVNKKIKSIDYVADYVIKYKSGKTEVIDIKGYPDSVALLKRKIFLYKYPNIIYKWISYSKKDGGWIEYDQLKKLRAQRKRKKKLNKGE